MKIIAIIPARYASTRFPGKPLADISGTSMIMRVYNQVKQVNLLSEVVVATDDQRIFDHVNEHGGKVVMTSSEHRSGTDRCLEALEQLSEKYDVVLNIQGDEPFIQPQQIEELMTCFSGDDQVEIASLVRQIENKDVLSNPNKVKVVLDKNNYALYFSRQAIPYLQGQALDNWLDKQTYYKHLGLYGYRSKTLREICQLPVSQLEKSESLEQLRWLENGYKIKLNISRYESHGVDVPEDITELLKSFGK